MNNIIEIKPIEYFKHTAYLYIGDSLIGELNYDIQVNEVCVDIYNSFKNGISIDNAYIMFNDIKVPISNTGRIRRPPEGFFETYNKQLRQLLK